MSIRTERPDVTVVAEKHDGIAVLPEQSSAAQKSPPTVWRHRTRMAADRTADRLELLWSDWRLGLGTTVAVAAGWGAIAGWWTPRGPLTSSQALWSIVISLAVGAAAGVGARSRWAMVISPAAFAAAFELVRLGTDGPTVDAPSASTYGIIAFVVGRGFHSLVSLFPIAFGAILGAAAARTISVPTTAPHTTGTWWLYTRRAVAVVAAFGLLVFTTFLARPASTDPILDANGNEIAGSVAELTTVDINGHDLHLMIRGHSVDNPVLLFLAGGPGGTEMGSMRNHLPELEEYFTVVTWDQRGSGRSYDELHPTDTYTLDAAVDDTIAVTNHLRERFEQDRIYVLGQSWGTTLGVLAVQRQPELYRAFIGTGQMVSQLATDTLFYQDTLAWAQANGNTGLVEDLLAIGPPPYDEMLNYETALANEQEVYAYDHTPNSEGEGQMSENLIVPEYALIDQIHALGAFMDTFSVLYPQLQDVDFRETATSFDIPMFFVQGAHEADGRAELFEEWYPTIDAPIKDLTVLDTSGHRPLFEQPDEFVGYMVDTVLAQTANNN